MADPELVQVMDYILNRCNEKNIEAVAAAVVRRRRDLALFGGVNNLPDPQTWAKNISAQLDMGGGIEGLKELVRSMAARIIKQEAPELTEEQIAELTGAWIPGEEKKNGGKPGLPADVLASMANQFISYSLGRMSEWEDKSLRNEMGAWPDRYWKAFPQVIRLIITDFLKGEITEGEFNSQLGAALIM
jgi:hypothetical protein